MRVSLKLPGLTPAISQTITQMLVVFIAAFGTQLTAAANGDLHNWPTLLAFVISAGGAGVVAVAHFLAGLVPTPTPLTSALAGAVPVKITNALSQILYSAVTVFVTMFGAQLAVGASGVTSVPTLAALIISAITAAATAVIQYVLKLIPTPVPAPATGGLVKPGAYFVGESPAVGGAK